MVESRARFSLQDFHFLVDPVVHRNRLRFVEGDAMDPAAAGIEGPFDGILMAYGIRNVPDPDTCLARVVSLLAPGGTLCLHEYSVRGSRRSTWTWDAVCFGIIVPSAKLAGNSTKLYRYLHESVRNFDSVSELESRTRPATTTESPGLSPTSSSRS